MSKDTSSELPLSFVLIGLMAFVFSGCVSQPMPSGSWQTSCGDVTEVSGARYCFYQTGPNPQYTIWFFHGAGDSEEVFRHSPFPQDSYIELGKGLPSVNIVAISYGLSWIMTDSHNRTFKPANATVDVFTSQIVPFIENNHHPANPYVAMGVSEGGITVATVCAAVPSMWSKCVLLNPMLPSCDPYGSLSCQFSGPGILIRLNYSETEWRTTKPLVLLHKTKDLPKSFVTACSSDLFGLFDGPKAWSDEARQLGFNSIWDPVFTKCDHFHWPADHALGFLATP
jgi:predicted esterase